MHAASVYPEPGSNSLKKYFIDTSYRFFTLLSLIFFALLLKFLFFGYINLFQLMSLWNLRVSSKLLTMISHCQFSLFSRLSLFNFQGPFASRFSRTALLVYHIDLRLSRGFQKFFKKYLIIFSTHNSI